MTSIEIRFKGSLAVSNLKTVNLQSGSLTKTVQGTAINYQHFSYFPITTAFKDL